MSVCLFSCAGAPSLTLAASGTCSGEQDACDARCARLADAHDCELMCQYEARRCNARQGEGQVAFGRESVHRVGDEQALLVDLFGPVIRHSSAIEVEKKGSVTPRDGAHELAPGAGVSLRVHLPNALRQAEIGLTHAPGGKRACFITVTVGDKTLVGRYSPPRHPTHPLRVEYWDLLPLIPPPPEDPEAPYFVDIFVFNNNAAGSEEPYRLAGVEFLYRVMQAE